MASKKISKALASARLKEAKKEGSDQEEVDALESLLKLYDTETAAKKAVKDAQAALDLAELKKYGTLTDDGTHPSDANGIPLIVRELQVPASH